MDEEKTTFTMEEFCRGMIVVCGTIVDDTIQRLYESYDGELTFDPTMSLQYGKAVKEALEVKDFYLTILQEKEGNEIKPTGVNPYDKWRK